MAIPAEWEGASPMNEEKQRVLLTPKEIGDNLSLEDEGTYPCSDGSWTATISVDKLLKAQLDKAWDMAMMIGKDKGFLAGLEQGLADRGKDKGVNNV